IFTQNSQSFFLTGSPAQNSGRGGRVKGPNNGHDFGRTECGRARWEMKAEALFREGNYVRLKLAPKTRMGTIESIKEERGRVQYLFLQDSRLDEAVPGSVFDAYVSEDEIELCTKPSDEYWKAMNALAKRGS